MAKNLAKGNGRQTARKGRTAEEVQALKGPLWVSDPQRHKRVPERPPDPGREIAFTLQAPSGWRTAGPIFDDGKIGRLRDLLQGHCPPDRIDALIHRARLAYLGIEHQAKDHDDRPVTRSNATKAMREIAKAADKLHRAWNAIDADMQAIIEREARSFLKPIVAGGPAHSLRRDLPTLLAALHETALDIDDTLKKQRVDKPAEYTFSLLLAEAWLEETGKRPGVSNNCEIDADDKRFVSPFERFVVEAATPFSIGVGVLRNAIERLG